MAYRRARGARVILHGAFAKERQVHAGGVRKKENLGKYVDTGQMGVLDDLIVDELNQKPWLLYPGNKYKNMWDVWILVLMVYTATYFPYLICFKDSSGEGQFYLDLFIDFGFFIDIILTFFTVTKNKDGSLEEERSKIACRYLVTWFPVDSFTTIPW